MTELEKNFFDLFGIEPNKWCKIGIDKDGNFYKEPIDKRYPQITDHILLKLICIINNYWQTKLERDYQLYSVNIDELKQEVLRDCMEYLCEPIDIECIKPQVQALFKEG